MAFDGTNMWVSNFLDGSVTRINAVTEEKVENIGIGNGAYGLAFDGTHIWITDNNGMTLWKIPAG